MEQAIGNDASPPPAAEETGVFSALWDVLCGGCSDKRRKRMEGAMRANTVTPKRVDPQTPVSIAETVHDDASSQRKGAEARFQERTAGAHWDSAPMLPEPRNALCAVAVQSALLALGGNDGTKTHTYSSVWEMDTEEGASTRDWITLKPLPQPAYYQVSLHSVYVHRQCC